MKLPSFNLLIRWPLRAAGHLLCVCAGLWLGSTLLGAATPLPEAPQVHEKLAWLAAHRTAYDTLFLGTSRVRRHILPSLFDQLAAAHGQTLHSFNLGVDSLAAPEDAYVLDRALALPLPHLRWVIIELSYFRFGFGGQEPDSLRAVYWHDCRRLGWLWRKFRDRELKPRRRQSWVAWWSQNEAACGVMAAHLRLFLQKTVHLGRGGRAFSEWAGLELAGDPFKLLGPARDGFISPPAEDALRGGELRAYERQLSALSDGAARDRTLDPTDEACLESLLSRIRALGATPILFLAPTPQGLVFRPRRPLAPLLDFSRPGSWPELFEPHLRADPGHFNTAGAEVFTRDLAESFFALFAPEGH